MKVEKSTDSWAVLRIIRFAVGGTPGRAEAPGIPSPGPPFSVFSHVELRRIFLFDEPVSPSGP